MANIICPCTRRKCVRRGSCDECRNYHAKSQRQHLVACEKVKSAKLKKTKLVDR